MRDKPEWETVEVPPRQPVIAEWPGEMESVSAFLDAVESGQTSRTHGALVAQLRLVGLAAEESAASSSWVAIERVD